MKSFGVYLHIRPDGTPFYVGKGTETRARNLTRKRSLHHASAVKNYGTENIDICYIPCPSETAAFEFEIDLIRILRGKGIRLVNQTDGGEGPSGRKDTESQRAWKSARAMGNTYSLGHRHSGNTRAKMSAAKKGKPISDVTKTKRLGMLGQKRPQEFCTKMADNAKGNTNTRGRKWITKGGESIRINLDDLARYLADGWTLGRKIWYSHGCG
jgi:hypothetical protein